MILTVTMNPSVDISYPLKKLVIDDVNRVVGEKKTAGGKGLNVTRGIHLSGHDVTATGVIGGTTGSYIKNQLDKDEIKHNFYTVNQESRNCIAILHEGFQTEILEAGPILSMNDQQGFLDHYQSLLNQFNVVTISGSLPQGLSITLYERLIQLAKSQNIPVLLDCSGPVLISTLKSQNKPYLIKPNTSELRQLLNEDIQPDSIGSLQNAVNHPILKDIPIIVISLGAQGAFIKHYHDCYYASIPKIAAINPVGSGDVTLGGLAVGILNHENIETMMKRAMTMGILNTLEAQTGFINMDNYDTYFQQVNVKKLAFN